MADIVDNSIQQQNSNNDDLDKTVNILKDTDGNGKWNFVVNKKKQKQIKRLKRIKKDNLLLEKKRTHIPQQIEVWYDENTWQFKLVHNRYFFEDGTSVLDKYNLLKLKKDFLNARNDYRRNGVYHKLMKVITKEEWAKIEKTVTYSLRKSKKYNNNSVVNDDSVIETE